MWVVGYLAIFLESKGGPLETFVTFGMIFIYLAIFIGTPLAGIGLTRAIREKSTINIVIGIIYFLWFAMLVYGLINGLGLFWFLKFS